MTACEIVQIALLAANTHNIRPDALVAIAMHETRLRVVNGDRGVSKGPWQLNCKVWLQVPCRRKMSVEKQAYFAAELFRKYRKKRRTLRGAIQLWNSKSKRYSRKVLRKMRKARKLIAKCTQE